MASDKKLIAEEQLLLKDIFHIKIYEDSLDKFNADLIFLPNFAKDLEYLPASNVSLLKNNTLFDSLLMERLAIPNTNVFEYLFHSYLRAKEEKTKSWNVNNPANQEFIDYSIQILQNFAHLFCSTPELFPEKVPEPKFDNISDPVQYTSARITELIQYGIEQEFVFGLIAKFETDQQEEIASQILSQILIDQSQRNLLDDKAIRNIQNIAALLQIDLFKRNFMKLKQYPWIPGPNNINLTKGVGSAMGNMMENASPLGIILKPSFLEPLYNSPKDKEKYELLLEKIQNELRRPMKKSMLEMLLKKYQGLQIEYCGIVTDIFKLLLKPTKDTIDYKTEVMRWFSALIVGNLSRTKLGMRLEHQNRALQYNSSDALCLNVFDVMLDICSKFLERNSPLLEKIDPSYYQFGWRFEYKETGMVNKPGVKLDESAGTQAKGPNDYGTVTEFFFHALELCHFCFIPILQNFSETMQYIQRMNEQKNLLDRNAPQFAQLEKELQRQEKIFLAYKTLLFDEKRIGRINDLYDVLTFLLLKWNGINPEEITSPDLSRFKPKNFMKFIPEHWISDLFEFHFTYIKFKEDYIKTLSNRYKGGFNIVNNYITFMCVILCENEMISNPYSKAKIVELVSFFGYENRSIRELYNTNELAKRILTPVLLKFYIDIEFTGASHQFYAKYEYRHYACSIFKIIWKLDAYKESYIKIAHSDLVERFTNMIMNDTTYCMDEGLDKLVKIIDLQSKEASGVNLSNEERRDLDRFEGTVRSVILQVKEGLDMMAEISSWAPQSFFFGDFRKRLAQMLNYFLVQLMSSKYMVLKANDKLNFKPSKLIKDIIQIYVNLSHDEEFCEEVTKDQRSYSFEEMSRAAKKARMDKVLYEGVIEQFEAFLARTEKISIQNMDISSKLGDIPDEFMCPISCDLMKEPVLLPTSNTVMEKSVIKQILLNDEHDPFNRFPLKFSEVKDLPELKKKIEDWMQRKLRGEILEEEKPKQIESSKEGKMEEEKEIEDENTYSDLFYQKKF